MKKQESAPLVGLRRVFERPRQTLRWLTELEHERKFDRWPGAYRGVFPSFEAARAAAPNDKFGYNRPELVNIYDHRLDKAFPSDYPTLFWISRLLGEARSLFDWGGHIGVTFYAYQRYLQLPDGFRWRVCEMSEIVKAGAELAAKKGETRLSFTTVPAEASGFDILLAAGSLQFMEPSPASELERLPQKPKHLLLNKLPLYPGEDFVTLQNTIHSYNPCKVWNRERFVKSITDLGYQVVDSWETPDMSCQIPLYPDHSVAAYSGYYFRRQS